jgi:diacylglycerol kinase family enzyme
MARSNSPFDEIDGEQPGVTPVHFEVLPAALRLRVPRA